MNILAKGINFSIGNAGSPTEVFNQILNITDVGLSGTTWDTEELTNHNTPDRSRLYCPTIRSEGEVSLTVKPWIAGNTQHTLIRTLSESGAARNFQITYPGSTLGTNAFSGYVSAFRFDTPIDGVHGAEITIQVHGSITDLPARITSVVITDEHEGSYVTGDEITLSAIFNEVVTVDDDPTPPRIAVVLDSGTVYAEYVTGSGTNVLKFAYEFAAEDQAEATELSITSPLGLNGGEINDMAAQAAVLTFTPPNTAAFEVNPE